MDTLTPFIEGLIAGYGIAIPVGAIAILIVELGLRGGFKVGFMAAAAEANPSTGGHLLFIIGAGLASLSWQTLLAGWGATASHRLPPGFQSFAVVGGNLVIMALGMRIVLALAW